MQDIVVKNPKIEKKPGCVAAALSVLGDKWTALIVLELAKGPRRFSALEQALEHISPRTLSERLDRMQHCGLLTKQSFAEVPPRVEYSLTPKGKDLIPILKSMATWGEKYHGLN
jgi:DNA-binding HxlR family transcriptional regulator